MAKPYKRLRWELSEQDIDQSDIAARWGCSTSTVSNKLTAARPFRITEAFDLLEMLKIPQERFAEYFPIEDIKKAEAADIRRN